MPRPRHNEVVILHPFVRLGETRNELDGIGSGFKVKPHPFLLVAFI